jgi:hypothetical protein
MVDAMNEALFDLPPLPAPPPPRPLCESQWCKPWPGQTHKKAKYEIAVPGDKGPRFMCGQHATYYRTKYGNRCARLLP